MGLSVADHTLAQQSGSPAVAGASHDEILLEWNVAGVRAPSMARIRAEVMAICDSSPRRTAPHAPRAGRFSRSNRRPRHRYRNQYRRGGAPNGEDPWAVGTVNSEARALWAGDDGSVAPYRHEAPVAPSNVFQSVDGWQSQWPAPSGRHRCCT